MTPEQKIKQLILLWGEHDEGKIEAIKAFDAKEIENAYDDLVNEDQHWDGMNETRYGEVTTDIPCDWSRRYESKSVAAKAVDGSWVGWTHWYGGGKYGEPEAIDWMDSAYDLTCVEEEKVITVRTFTKA